MFRKIIFFSIWLAFIAYAFLLAPPDRPDTLELIKNLSAGNWDGINPLVIALFNLMGIWPAVYGCLLFADGRGQKIGAWPFVLGSFGLGAFALLPYLALRQPNREFVGEKNLSIRVWDSRILAIVLTVAAAVLIVYGLREGNWADFVVQWQSRRFIHVMSLDFCLLSVLFPTLLGDDMAKRGMSGSIAWWVISVVPLLGPLAYLCVRSPLPESMELESSAVN
ncbi:MAG: DUF2834 domain-containing protein [Cyanobacteriota bacterium]|nr:DUF2834 domain-containing protein [Cyanobacteriota bacterium]